MQRIKHEVKHYVNGTKLLGYEIKISTKLLIKLVQGYELSRRETNQLKRTMGDVFRLVPFSAFIIVPFAELLLPIALKIFPNLLPSTYESGKDKQLKKTKLNEIRQKTSNFLQETLEESSLISYKSIENAEKKKKFLNFFKKLNSPKNGQTSVFTHDEILAVAQMFKNDTVLDNLSRPQLVAMAKYMSLRPFGNDNILRYQIRYNLKKIMEDDKVIDYEGVDSLSNEELYQTCVSRGIKTFGVPREDLVENIKVWLELRLRHKVPSVLMILGSVYTFDGIEAAQASVHCSASEDKHLEDVKFHKLLDFYYDGILQVLSSIPDPVYNVAKLDVTEPKEQKAPATESKAKETVKDATSAATNVGASTSEAPAETATATAAATDAAPISGTASPVTPETPSGKKEEEQPEKTEVKSEPVEEEEEHRSDDNEFKLNVLKEQEELIKKEEEEAKKRTTSREVIEDNINLDEEDSPTVPIPAKDAPETAVSKKNE